MNHITTEDTERTERKNLKKNLCVLGGQTAPAFSNTKRICKEYRVIYRRIRSKDFSDPAKAESFEMTP